MFTAGASMAYYAGGYQAAPKKPAKPAKPAKDGRPGSSRDAARESTPKSPAPTEKSFSSLSTMTASDFLEPALDGPPSPERLRQLSKHMRRTSHLRGQKGHQPAASASSSLTSFNAELSTWEQDLNNMTSGLTRQSSSRSAASSSPSRERTDAVPRFGKSLFHRRAKSKRESGSHSSSNSSLYSTDLPVDGAVSGPKESFIPGLFSRRKSSRDDTAAQRKPQISVPFNFQHVTHSHHEKQKGKKQRGNRTDLTLDLDLPNTAPADTTNTPAAYLTPNLENVQLPNISLESPDERYEEARSAPSSARPQLLPRHTTPVSGARRLMKQARSQDQLRVHPPRAPPRPPRSPIQPPTSSSFTPPPPPPPRSSSRQSTYADGYGSFITTPFERPQTSGGFRRPLPFSPSDSPESLPSPAARQGYHSPADSEVFPTDDKLLSPTLSTSSETAWPLSGSQLGPYEGALSDVPEEDEHHALTRRSRLSIASNNSSLRGSHSVPMLRALAQSHRPTSGASETLGSFDTAAAQQATRAGPAGSRESWEDDIDYCYEHEVEADCDYQWERPSLDSARDIDAPPILVALLEGELAEAQPASAAKSSPGMLSAPEFDMPVLSPGSQSSPTLADGTATSTSPSGVTNNFSLPRAERKGHRSSFFKSSNRASTASSFKESHGFTLSPSLLIPSDYQQELLLCEAQKYDDHEDNEVTGPCHQAAFYDGGSVQMDRLSTLKSHLRSSTSTTETHSTSRSTSTGERHESTNSTWTALTRHTASNTSLNKMVEELAPTSHVVGQTLDDGGSQSSLGAFQDTVPELGPFSVTSVGKKPYHKSHASESVVHDDLPPMRSPELKKTRRPRARTTSLSAQAPPTGQYALFPRGQLKGNGDRI